jgi:hypothetical protein
MASLFVQVTVVPAATLKVAGEKAIFLMLTVCPAGGGLPVPGVVPGLLLLLLPQEITHIPAVARNIIPSNNILYFIVHFFSVYVKREVSVASGYGNGLIRTV